jgi:glucose/arabinose dehydrogenase
MRYNKIICFGVILLFFGSVVTVISSSTPSKEKVTTDETTLGIEFVSSGFDVDYKISELFGVSAVIRNRGSINATDVHWSISSSGGFIVVGKEASGTIPLIFPGDVAVVKIPFTWGFGKTQITATADASNANTIVANARAQVTGCRVELLPGTEDSLVISLDRVVQGLTAPVIVTHAGDGSNRLFVAEQTGKIVLIEGGSLQSTPFLDLSSKIVKLIPVYDERGLLGLAFHPDFKNNGRFYVYYTAPTDQSGVDHQNIIAEYQVSEDNPNKADPNSERIILIINQPEFNHCGGQLAFGSDGYLYVGVGDGGGEGDPSSFMGNGQDINTLLGKILRIDVNRENAYDVPSDNPFVGKDGLDEIYAYGFRNPFRFSFDSMTGRLFAGDVGQDLWEEIDIVENGGNYGWKIMEGNHLYDPALALDLGINISMLSPPIHDYSHYVGHCVIGGFVYRGTQYPSLVGKYVFGDWSATYFQPRGKLFYLEEVTPDHWKQMEFRFSDDKPLNLRVLSIGSDESGELYVLTQRSVGPILHNGEMWHIVVESGEV